MMTKHITGNPVQACVRTASDPRRRRRQDVPSRSWQRLDPIDLIDGIGVMRWSPGAPPAYEPQAGRQHREEEDPQGIPDGIPCLRQSDALRFTFALSPARGRDIKFDMSRCGGLMQLLQQSSVNATRFCADDPGPRPGPSSTAQDGPSWWRQRPAELSPSPTAGSSAARVEKEVSDPVRRLPFRPRSRRSMNSSGTSTATAIRMSFAKVQINTGNEAQQRGTRRTLIRKPDHPAPRSTC